VATVVATVAVRESAAVDKAAMVPLDKPE